MRAPPFVPLCILSPSIHRVLSPFHTLKKPTKSWKCTEASRGPYTPTLNIKSKFPGGANRFVVLRTRIRLPSSRCSPMTVSTDFCELALNDPTS